MAVKKRSLHQVAKEYHEKKAVLDSVAAEVEQLKAEILSLVGAGASSINVASFRGSPAFVVKIRHSYQVRFNQAAFKAAHLVLFEQFKNQRVEFDSVSVEKVGA